MDLNELFLRYQITSMDADQASGHDDRRKFAAQADCLAAQIGSLQHRLGAHAAPFARAAAA